MKQQQSEPLIERPAILILDAPAAEGAPEAGVFAEAGLEARILGPCPAGAPIPPDWLAEADFILTHHTAVDEAMIRQARRCLLIAHYGLGSGPGVARIAFEAARATGIYLASVPDYAAPAWAGRTFELVDELRSCWPELADQTISRAKTVRPLRLGLVGLGQVGRRAARLGQGRGMEVWASDPFAGPEVFAQHNVRPADLPSLCGICDILSLHLPLGPATRRIISADLLALLKPSSLLINVSHPELVDLDALAASLAREHPAGAAFDEDLAAFLLPGHPLLDRSGRASSRLLHGPRQAGEDPASAATCRRRVAELVVQTLRGDRPAHLLIDPPCPRHILLMANQSWT